MDQIFEQVFNEIRGLRQVILQLSDKVDKLLPEFKPGKIVSTDVAECNEELHSSSTPADIIDNSTLNASEIPENPSVIARRKLGSTWTTLEKKRRATLFKARQNQGIANLYLEWADLPTPMLPRKFKKPNMYIGTHEEQNIRQQFALKSMMAEAEILLLRAEKQEQDFRRMDEQIMNEISKYSDTACMAELKQEWTSLCENQENLAQRDWSRKKEWLCNITKPLQDPESKIKHTKEKSTKVTTPATPVGLQTNHRQRQHAHPSRRPVSPESPSYAEIVKASPHPAHATSTKTAKATNEASKESEWQEVRGRRSFFRKGYHKNRIRIQRY